MMFFLMLMRKKAALFYQFGDLLTPDLIQWMKTGMSIRTTFSKSSSSIIGAPSPMFYFYFFSSLNNIRERPFSSVRMSAASETSRKALTQALCQLPTHARRECERELFSIQHVS
jgi:hypothetical protein